MSSAHKVLIALRNPFINHDERYVSKPCLVWLTRDDYRDGRDENRVIGHQYLLLIYGFGGKVKWHYEISVLHRMHRPRTGKPGDKPFVKCARCGSAGTLCTCGFAHHSVWWDDHPPLDGQLPPCPDCAHLRDS